MIEKDATVTDKDWPEFGTGCVTVFNKKRCTVLFRNGVKRYQAPYDKLMIVKTAKENEEAMKQAFKEWAENEHV